MQDLIEEANKTYLENFNKDIEFIPYFWQLCCPELIFSLRFK